MHEIVIDSTGDGVVQITALWGLTVAVSHVYGKFF